MWRTFLHAIARKWGYMAAAALATGALALLK